MKALSRSILHAAWANRQWIDFICGQNPSDPHALKLMGHILAGEKLWFERITGQPRTKELFPVLEREALLALFEANHLEYQRLLSSRLEDVVPFKRITGEQYQASVADILLHLITHGYHHRGQLAAHFARKGVKYPNTDHINYLIQNCL